MLSGSRASGSIVSGSIVSGSMASGSMASGSVMTGSVISVSAASDSTLSSSTVSGSADPGSTDSGSTGSNSTGSGSNVSGSTAGGSTLSGSAASSSLCRDSAVSCSRLPASVGCESASTTGFCDSTPKVCVEGGSAMIVSPDVSSSGAGFVSGIRGMSSNPVSRSGSTTGLSTDASAADSCRIGSDVCGSDCSDGAACSAAPAANPSGGD